ATLEVNRATDASVAYWRATAAGRLDHPVIVSIAVLWGVAVTTHRACRTFSTLPAFADRVRSLTPRIATRLVTAVARGDVSIGSARIVSCVGRHASVGDLAWRNRRSSLGI